MIDWTISEFLNNISIYLIIKDEIKMLEERRKELRLGILEKLKEFPDGKAENYEFVATRKLARNKSILEGATDFLVSRGLERYLEAKLEATISGMESAMLNDDITEEEYRRFVNENKIEHLEVMRKDV